jgi:hypothetical protein
MKMVNPTPITWRLTGTTCRGGQKVVRKRERRSNKSQKSESEKSFEIERERGFREKKREAEGHTLPLRSITNTPSASVHVYPWSSAYAGACGTASHRVAVVKVVTGVFHVVRVKQKRREPSDVPAHPRQGNPQEAQHTHTHTVKIYDGVYTNCQHVKRERERDIGKSKERDA